MSESDESLRARVISAYGMWGAFCSLVLEASGEELDKMAEHVGVKREGPGTALARIVEEG